MNRDKTWSCQQVRGVTGVLILSLWSFLIASELPLIWEIPLVATSLVCLIVSGITSGVCFYTDHRRYRHRSGSGALCDVCNAPISVDTYHCSICDECVPAYFHHSRWLNCCIGECNLWSYTFCVGSLFLLGACQTISQVVLLTLMIRDRATTLRLNSKYSLLDYGFLFRQTLWFFLFVSIALMLSNGCYCCKVVIVKYTRHRIDTFRGHMQSTAALQPGFGYKAEEGNSTSPMKIGKEGKQWESSSIIGI